VNESEVTLATAPLPNDQRQPELLPSSRVSFVHRITRRRGVRQFVKFGIVGFSALIVNAVIFTLLQHNTPLALQHARYNWNDSIGFLSGGASDYVLNRLSTFRSRGHTLLQGTQFIVVSAMALAVNLGVSQVLEPHLGPGHRTWFIATLAATGVNFFVNKYWTFRDT